ncbi:MAG: hypothetical protein IPI81_16460 [Flavobacteriales bacterium]|nr:hypothetical protein [Flavobacteriales bacterium]
MKRGAVFAPIAEATPAADVAPSFSASISSDEHSELPEVELTPSSTKPNEMTAITAMKGIAPEVMIRAIVTTHRAATPHTSAVPHSRITRASSIERKKDQVIQHDRRSLKPMVVRIIHVPTPVPVTLPDGRTEELLVEQNYVAKIVRITQGGHTREYRKVTHRYGETNFFCNGSSCGEVAFGAAINSK